MNAVGQNLQKIVKTSALVTRTTDYQDGFQYIGAVLLFFPTTEGYVNNTVVSGVNKYNYVYNYLDHLGNVRMSYAKDPVTNALTILEENHYYPFGLKHTNYNTNLNAFANRTATNTVVMKAIAPGPIDGAAPLPFQYKFSGKEYQDELGLNTLDFGNRNYDPAIGRFFNIDKFANKYSFHSPYQYAANNPIIFNDIMGDSIYIYPRNGKNVQYHEGKFYKKNPDTNKMELYGDSAGEKIIGFLKDALNAIEKISKGGPSGKDLIDALQYSAKPISIRQNAENKANAVAGLVYWSNSNYNSNGNQRPSFIGLAHELGHAYDGLDGAYNKEEIGKIGDEIIEYAEYAAMTWENLIRDEHDLDLRDYYGFHRYYPCNPPFS